MEKNKVIDEVLGDSAGLVASDLYSADFKTAFRGYDKQRVQGFLSRVADAYETLQREVAQLREQNTDLREQVATYRDMEKSLTEALASAQAVAETTLSQANREAALIVEEAQAKRSGEEAKSAAIPDELRQEIATLRAKRARLKADLRAVLNIHLGMLNDTGVGDGESVEFMPEDTQYAASPEDAPEQGGKQGEGDNQ